MDCIHMWKHKGKDDCGTVSDLPFILTSEVGRGTFTCGAQNAYTVGGRYWVSFAAYDQ